MNQLDTETSTQLEESTDFTLRDHYKERVSFHMRMLNHYLKEQKNDRMGN
jgi:hypothetical protein